MCYTNHTPQKIMDCGRCAIFFNFSGFVKCDFPFLLRWCAKNRTPYNDFRWVMVCNCSSTPQNSRPGNETNYFNGPPIFDDKWITLFVLQCWTLRELHRPVVAIIIAHALLMHITLILHLLLWLADIDFDRCLVMGELSCHLQYLHEHVQKNSQNNCAV